MAATANWKRSSTHLLVLLALLVVTLGLLVLLVVVVLLPVAVVLFGVEGDVLQLDVVLVVRGLQRLVLVAPVLVVLAPALLVAVA